MAATAKIKGKPESGRLEITVRDKAGKSVIEISDSGYFNHKSGPMLSEAGWIAMITTLDPVHKKIANLAREARRLQRRMEALGG